MGALDKSSVTACSWKWISSNGGPPASWADGSEEAMTMAGRVAIMNRGVWAIGERRDLRASDNPLVEFIGSGQRV